MIRKMREWMFQVWYWYVSNIDKNAEVIFMNYGYSSADMPVELEPKDEPNRYSAQLYHLLASAVDLKNKNIAEIGCGRGGGLSYVTRTFAPATALGVDLNQRASDFCNDYYKIDGLRFKQGDAQDLSFIPDASFDGILNVESSHRYPRFDLFLSEVVRLLRPGGHFLFTDFRYSNEIDNLRKQLEGTGMTILKVVDITSNVVEALTADDARKRELVHRLAPRVLRDIALNFAGAIGSETYNQFANRKYEYVHYVLQKN
jgi:SAM-dependent methyltransferase